MDTLMHWVDEGLLTLDDVTRAAAAAEIDLNDLGSQTATFAAYLAPVVALNTMTILAEQYEAAAAATTGNDSMVNRAVAAQLRNAAMALQIDASQRG